MYHCDVGGDDDDDDHGSGGGEEVFALHAFHLLEPCALARPFATFRFFMIPISQQYNLQMLYIVWHGSVRYVRCFFPIHIFSSFFPMLFSFSFQFFIIIKH